jgi:hypothetical protein
VDGAVVEVVVVDDVVEEEVVEEVDELVVDEDVVVVGPELTLMTITEFSPTFLPAAGAWAKTMSWPKSSFGSNTSVADSPALSSLVRAS